MDTLIGPDQVVIANWDGQVAENILNEAPGPMDSAGLTFAGALRVTLSGAPQLRASTTKFEKSTKNSYLWILKVLTQTLTSFLRWSWTFSLIFVRAKKCWILSQKDRLEYWKT